MGKGHEAAGFTVLFAGDASVLAFLALAAALESLFLTVFLAGFFAVDDLELVDLVSVSLPEDFTLDDADGLLAGAAAVSVTVDLLALLALLPADEEAVLLLAFLAALAAVAGALLAAVLVAVFLAAVDLVAVLLVVDVVVAFFAAAFVAVVFSAALLAVLVAFLAALEAVLDAVFLVASDDVTALFLVAVFVAVEESTFGS